MTATVWPKLYQLDGKIPGNTKILLKYAEDNFPDGLVVYGIPIPGSKVKDIQNGIYISPRNGVMTFTIISHQFNPRNIDDANTFAKLQESMYLEYMLKNSELISKYGRNNLLKFPYKHILVFINDESITITKKILKIHIDRFVANKFLPANKYSRDVEDLFKSIHIEYDTNFNILYREDLKNIVKILVPSHLISKEFKEIHGFNDNTEEEYQREDVVPLNDLEEDNNVINSPSRHEKERNLFMHVYPEDFEKRDHITKEERSLIRFALDKFPGGHFATGINPLGLSTEKAKIGMFLSPKEGLITFSIITEPFNDNLINIYPTLIKTNEDKIYSHLLNSRMLIVKSGNYKTLKFPYKHILVFVNEKTINIDEKYLKELEGRITANLFVPLNKKQGDDIHLFDRIEKGYDPNFSSISESEIPSIFERIVPEYTTSMIEKENIEIKENSELVPIEKVIITEDEADYKSFKLDDYQISIINDMGSGHRVILANPGAGKSVLLLSKAMKFAGLNPKSNVLLTCYNNNLAEAYKIKYTRANLVDRDNMRISTLHKLVQMIYEDILHKRIKGAFPDDEEIEECVNLARDGKVKYKFGAIFIDEVQIFEPKYIELCYYLLDKQPNNIFLMAGDLNQMVRKQSRRGDAPWKKMDSVSLDFTGRVKYIERNYRNSKDIGEYLNSMLKYMNNMLTKYDMINNKDYEYNTFDMGDFETIALNIEIELSRGIIQQKIINAIHELTNLYHLNYSDIAILFPYRQQRNMRYFIYDWIKKALDNEGIQYSSIISTNKYRNEKTRLSEINGITLSTIESSLGIEFKAVILTGLYPYNYIIRSDEDGSNYSIKRIDSWSDILNLSSEEKEILKIQMRNIYTAASRAREVLYILSDINKGNPIGDIIKDRR